MNSLLTRFGSHHSSRRCAHPQLAEDRSPSLPTDRSTAMSATHTVNSDPAPSRLDISVQATVVYLGLVLRTSSTVSSKQITWYLQLSFTTKPLAPSCRLKGPRGHGTCATLCCSSAAARPGGSASRRQRVPAAGSLGHQHKGLGNEHQQQAQARNCWNKVKSSRTQIQIGKKMEYLLVFVSNQKKRKNKTKGADQPTLSQTFTRIKMIDLDMPF